MLESSATIIAALVGFVGGLVVAAFTFRQKADELFLAGLEYLDHGSQRRNLGIAALELSWPSRRHRVVTVQLLVGVALYLLLESEQRDAAHEVANLERIMELVTSKDGRACLADSQRTTLLRALETKREQPTSGRGVWIEVPDLDRWIDRLQGQVPAQ